MCRSCGPLIAESVGMTTLARPNIWCVALFAAVFLFAACANQTAEDQPPQRAQLTQAISTPRRNEPPEPLTQAARVFLKQRMAAHARDMDQLVSAIMLLEYPNIAARADKIVTDVNLTRPLTGDASELTSSLPEKFFVRQDDLKTAARLLGDAARALEPYRVADAYGKLSEACVRCHADYRPHG